MGTHSRCSGCGYTYGNCVCSGSLLPPRGLLSTRFDRFMDARLADPLDAHRPFTQQNHVPPHMEPYQIKGGH